MTVALKAARRLGVLLLALVSVLAVTQSQAQAVTYLELTNRNSIKCLAIPGSSESNGVVPVQWQCTGNTDQRWELRQEADNRVRLVNQNSGKCLVVGSVTPGSKPFQFGCSSANPPSETDLWIHDSIGRLRSMYADLCLAVPNSSTANGVELILWNCSLNYDQRWYY
ncbi:hypothetical protein BN159_3680 [Streptomyces davaonensis JCM 4913]|uniref:Ricin B lectin domain-containing protein n=1 Tax=Streptomyces davaonensis (strain DSM 101723 / JCM 4913 / KCC S-0913 / 768) TaxID=1214101 RepID=K4R5R8_STRDJ|nr:RICIN domain-containing protein [Streptomyces davaonensis]CCK28059.1 hypothetical protein BN159_3680 [Streptomyces davaonensis JCM 4913]